MATGNAKIRPTDPDRLFLQYQDDWIDDRSRLKLFEKSRQIGISWATADGTVERTAAREARFDQWVSSRDEIQARLFIEDCKKFGAMINAGMQDLGLIVIDEKERTSAYVLQFANGKRIHSMSSNPDAQAGKRGGRVLDEFALHGDPRKLYTIAYPGITWGGQLEIISTHRGSANFFNELVQEAKQKGNPKGFSLHTVTLQDALDQGFLFKLQSVIASDDPIMAMDEAEYFDFIKSGCASEEQFLQEYMCVPADDEAAFLSYDLIAGCEYKASDRWELDLGDLSRQHLYMGVDVGRTHDLTVLWILERIAGLMLTRKVITMQKKSFSAQEAQIYRWLDKPQIKRACFDDTGLGMQLAERAVEKYGKYRIEPVRFNATVKEELAYPLRAAFEDKTIRIPWDDKVRADLRSIRKTTTAAGNIRFEADTGPGGHADRFWALALAQHAAAAAKTSVAEALRARFTSLAGRFGVGRRVA